ncbi:Intron-binding protein aquarius [Porphyridium purpureum]|uniref:Intron-binding protein aquarius n=1 Tax=Porphyridium purpureum TaxID=35688 RepID=A0A5J4YY48_PORPP|nr:Intron-binding protein aquarius [Porphyridium purpureum]|eukprot:POR6096..scf209_3
MASGGARLLAAAARQDWDACSMPWNKEGSKSCLAQVTSGAIADWFDAIFVLDCDTEFTRHALLVQCNRMNALEEWIWPWFVQQVENHGDSAKDAALVDGEDPPDSVKVAFLIAALVVAAQTPLGVAHAAYLTSEAGAERAFAFCQDAPDRDTSLKRLYDTIFQHMLPIGRLWPTSARNISEHRLFLQELRLAACGTSFLSASFHMVHSESIRMALFPSRSKSPFLKPLFKFVEFLPAPNEAFVESQKQKFVERRNERTCQMNETCIEARKGLVPNVLALSLVWLWAELGGIHDSQSPSSSVIQHCSSMLVYASLQLVLEAMKCSISRPYVRYFLTECHVLPQLKYVLKALLEGSGSQNSEKKQRPYPSQTRLYALLSAYRSLSFWISKHGPFGELVSEARAAKMEALHAAGQGEHVEMALLQHAAMRLVLAKRNGAIESFRVGEEELALLSSLVIGSRSRLASDPLLLQSRLEKLSVSSLRTLCEEVRISSNFFLVQELQPSLPSNEMDLLLHPLLVGALAAFSQAFEHDADCGWIFSGSGLSEQGWARMLRRKACEGYPCENEFWPLGWLHDSSPQARFFESIVESMISRQVGHGPKCANERIVETKRRRKIESKNDDSGIGVDTEIVNMVDKRFALYFSVPRLLVQFPDEQLLYRTVCELLSREAAYGIGARIRDVLERMDPDPRLGKNFRGWARHGACVKSLRVLDVDLPALDDPIHCRPARIVALLELELPSATPREVERSWILELGHENLLFLVQWAPTKEGDHVQVERVRTVRILSLASSDGVRTRTDVVLSRFDSQERLQERHLFVRVELDCERLYEDMRHGFDCLDPGSPTYCSDVSNIVAKESFAVVVKRNRRENAALDLLVTAQRQLKHLIRKQVKSFLPSWLGPTVAGYGNPALACRARCSLGGDWSSVAPWMTSEQRTALESIQRGGLTLIDGPPGTGKTELIVQSVSSLLQCLNERSKSSDDNASLKILVLCRTSQSLSALLGRLVQNPGASALLSLVRLGGGEEQEVIDDDAYGNLCKSSWVAFGLAGRLALVESQRASLLAQVRLYAESMGLNSEYSMSCASAQMWIKQHCEPRLTKLKLATHPEQATLHLFPFYDVTDPAWRVYDTVSAERWYEHTIGELRDKLELYRPLELLRGAHEREHYIMATFSRVLLMTSSFAGRQGADLVDKGIRFGTIMVDEASLLSELETLLSLSVQQGQQVDLMERVVLLGDSTSLLPVVQNPDLTVDGNAQQSMFQRLQRLGAPVHRLGAQFRSRTSMVNLFREHCRSGAHFRAGARGTLMDGSFADTDGLQPDTVGPWFKKCNPGFLAEAQWVDVAALVGRQGSNAAPESCPVPNFYQNRAEAEILVSVYIYMLFIGYPAGEIAILTPYNGQRELLVQVLQVRLAELGRMRMPVAPLAVSTIDSFQSQQASYVLLSVVRTSTLSYLSDARRIVASLSRARLGLYIFSGASANVRTACKAWSAIEALAPVSGTNLILLPEERFDVLALRTWRDAGSVVDSGNTLRGQVKVRSDAELRGIISRLQSCRGSDLSDR